MSNHVTTRTQEEIAALFTQDLVTGVGRSVKHDSAPMSRARRCTSTTGWSFPISCTSYARMSERAHARIVSIDTSPCQILAWPSPSRRRTYRPAGHRCRDARRPAAGRRQGRVHRPAGDRRGCRQPGNRTQGGDGRDHRIRGSGAVLDVVEALHKKHFVLDSHTHKRGDSATALASAPRRLQGSLHIGGQEHFYLETQVSRSCPPKTVA